MKGSSKIVEEILKILKDHNLSEEFDCEPYFTRTLHKNDHGPITIVKDHKRVCVLLIKMDVNTKIEFFADFEIINMNSWKILSVTFGDKVYEYPTSEQDASPNGVSSRIDNFLSIWADKLKEGHA